MAEDKDTLTIKKSSLQWLVVVIVVLVVGFGIGRFTAPTSVVVQNQPIVPAVVPSTPPANNPTPSPIPTKVNVQIGDRPILGNPNAKVTIVEFSDFQCPFCEKIYTQVEKQLKIDYIDTGKVKMVFKHFPLSFHQNAQKAAEASECANEQNKFWAYHDVLFEKQSAWSSTDGVTAFKQYAVDLGLDTAKFNSCLDTGKYASAVTAQQQEGSSLGVSGTPTTFINGQQIVGAQPYTSFKQIIDRELAA